MRVDRPLRGLQRRHAVMVVQRIEEFQVQHRAARQAERLSVDGVFIGLGPAAGRGHRLHPVGPQRIEFARRIVHVHALDIGIARNQQETIEHLQEFAAVLARIGPGQQRQQRMLAALGASLIGEPGNRCRRLRDHADRAISHRICGEALGGQGRIVARRPLRLARRMQRDHRRHCRALALKPQPPQNGLEHRVSCHHTPSAAPRHLPRVPRGRMRTLHPSPPAGKVARSAGWGRSASHSTRTRGSGRRCSTSSLTAQTSASSRSGLPASPIRVHISSSSSGNAPTCDTRPCS